MLLKILNFWLYNCIFYANVQFLFDLLFDFLFHYIKCTMRILYIPTSINDENY